jgi:hypothetical protein
LAQPDKLPIRICAQGIQFDNTVRVRSGCIGSLVGRRTRKLWKPPIAPCIMNCIERLVLSPGWRAIEPMVGVGGQQPSTTSIYGCFENRRGWSPPGLLSDWARLAPRWRPAVQHSSPAATREMWSQGGVLHQARRKGRYAECAFSFLPIC